MSALSRWLGRIADRSIDRFARTSTLSQAIRERSRRDILALPRYDDPKRLARFEHQIFSQGGEDGIVREVFRRVGERSRTFVELGVGDGLENNTTFLLAQGWRGAWFDASAKECAKIRARFSHEIEARQLVLVESMLTAANVSATVAPHCNPNDLDLLSIDLDRNTYHVWAALDALKPRVAIVEYNALFPADVEWIVEDDAAKSWNGTSHFGASLKSLERLGTRLGYALVGCDIAGVNAFFVRGDLAGDAFSTPATSEHHYEPVRYYLHTKVGHPRAWRD